MDGRIERAYSGLRTVVREVRREDVAFMAASIAYHAFISLLPILLLLVLVVSAVGGRELVQGALDLVGVFLPVTGERVVTDAVRNASGSAGASLISVVVLLWGTIRIFRAMDAAFAEIYDTERKVSTLDRFRDAVVVLGALAVAALATIGFGSAVRVPDAIPFANALDGLVSVLGLAVAFFPMYYVFPNVEVSIRDVLPGILVAAVGWSGLQWLFNVYVSLSNKPDLYGSIGTLMLLILWLYVGGLILLVGAAVNATLAGRGGDHPPGRGGRRQFGKQITDPASFQDRLDEVVHRARDADVPDETVRRTLRKRAETVTDGGPGADADERRDAAQAGEPETGDGVRATDDADR